MSALVNEEPAQELLTTNSTRRLALLIPLLLPSSNGSSTANEQTSLLSGNSNNSRTRILFLVLTVPNSSSSSSSEGLSDLNFSNFGGLNTGSEEDEENEFQELLNRLLQNFQPRGPPPASKSFVDTLPIIQIDESSKAEAIRCPVCLLDFELEEEALKLPCKHLFHQDCIKTWLKQANTCCVCRHELPVEEETEAKESTVQEVESESNRGTNDDQEYSELPDLMSDFTELPSLEDLFSLVPEVRESITQFVNAPQAPVVQEEVPSSPAPRMLEDDLPAPRRNNNSRGPVQWMRRQFTCFRGLFS